MSFTDPGDRSIMVDYDPFQDARAPAAVKEAEHVKEEHGKASADSEPSGSPTTRSAVGPELIGKPHEGEWESLDGPVYYNTSFRNEDGNTRYVNHFINVKPEDPEHQAGSRESPSLNGPSPTIGKIIVKERKDRRASLTETSLQKRCLNHTNKSIT